MPQKPHTSSISPLTYSHANKPPTIPYYTPVTHIKGSKALTAPGRAIIPTLPIQHQHIFNFLLQKASGYNTITFSKDLFAKYKGYCSLFILLPNPSQKTKPYKSYTMFKRVIISLLNAHILLKPCKSSNYMMINPAYAHSTYHGVPHLASNFGKEYGKLLKLGELSENKLVEMCDKYVKEAKRRMSWHDDQYKAA